MWLLLDSILFELSWVNNLESRNFLEIINITR